MSNSSVLGNITLGAATIGEVSTGAEENVVSVTTEDATLSAQASLEISGDLSSTADDAAITAQGGSFDISGSLSSTADVAVVVSDGTLPIAGSLAKTTTDAALMSEGLVGDVPIYPTRISTSAFLPNPVFSPGPYFHNGNIYVVLISHATGTRIHVYKSSDLGQTWAEQDAGNNKEYEQSNTSSPVDTTVRGDILYITYVPLGGTTLNVAQFDMSSDTWGTVVTGGPTPLYDGTCKSVVLSNGDIRTVYTENNGSGYWRIAFATYSGGSWSSGAPVFDPGVDEIPNYYYALMGVQRADDDNTMVLCSNGAVAGLLTGRLRARNISPGGSLGDMLPIPLRNVHDTNPPLSGISTMFGSTEFVFPCFAYHLRSTSSNPYLHVPTAVLLGTSPLAPSARSEFFDLLDPAHNQNDLVDNGFSPGHPTMSAAYVPEQGALFMYWAHFDGDGTFKIKRACSRLCHGWGPTTDILTSSFDPSSGYAGQINWVSARAKDGTNDIGIAFSAAGDNGTTFDYRYPHFQLDEATSCSAPACGGGGASHSLTGAVGTG